MTHALRLPMTAAWLLLAALQAPPAQAADTAASPAPRRLELDDLERIEQLSQPHLSPDGRRVAFTAKDMVHVVDLDGGTPRAVTASGSAASDSRWSRDGRWLYFLSDRADKKQQLWKLPTDTFGEATQLSSLDRGIDDLNLSPDETRLLVVLAGTIDTQATSDPAGKAANAESGAAKTEPKKPALWVITRLHFKEDEGDGYLTSESLQHLYIYDLRTKALRQLTSGDYSESEAAWSPDGRSIVFVSNRAAEPDASYKTDLWIVAADAAPGGELVRLTSDDSVKGSPQWSPDGRSIAYLSAVDGVYGLPQVAVIAATGGAARFLTQALDRWVNDFRYSPDGKWIYFTYQELGGSHLARVRVADGKLERILEGERQISSFDVAANGSVVARLENMNDASELYAVAKGRARKLTSFNDEFLGSVQLGAKEKIEFRSPDGTPVEAFVIKPPGFDPARRYPTALHIHGGPVGQFAYGYEFTAQYLAANGYVVVEPNPRGSTGRGQDYVRAIYQTWGITDYDDVIAAVDRVIELGFADPERLAVFGYSYGGYMTNTVITRTNRFKAAASGAGHSLIVANYGHDIYQKWYNWELGVPWENAEKYARLSPLLQAGKVETPTIFLGGRNDWNVPVLNAELFYQSLRQRGIETQLVVYPDTHHGGWSDDFNKDFLLRIRQWFDKHLAPDRAGGQPTTARP
jgi:dipeptidyl aminopeptidase/acylaminoacyl peptidase